MSTRGVTTGREKSGWTLRLRACLLLTVVWAGAVMGCPSMCSCKWKGGKEWVECADRGLTGLPQGAREETQVLDLSNNRLVDLPAECFQVLGLVNLQKLFLGKSHIQSIAARAFKGLVGLVELDLSGNLLEDVPSDTFRYYPGLMRLILSENPIREVRPGAFRHLEQLTSLELKGCQIVSIAEGAFNGLHALEWLRLDGNRLNFVPNNTLPLGKNLHGLTLHNNPWTCNCKLRAMQQWLKLSAPAAPQESEPVCESPEKLKSRLVKSLKLHELACLPEISPSERIDAYEGGNVTLKCDVYAVPPADISWWCNGEIFQLQNENDTFSPASSTSTRFIQKQRGLTNMSSVLYIYNVETIDEGTYTCVAENAAGSAEANLSLRVLFREKATAEPPVHQPVSGYVAAIAAGALVGTLFALGCIVAGIVFCTKRRNRKRAAKSLVSQSKSILPISKDALNENANFEHPSHPPLERDRNSIVEGGRSIEDYGVPKYLTEPDLINEVPENSEGYNIYQHQMPEGQIFEYDPSGFHVQPDLRSNLHTQMSYLDQDGYPLNFGLPKLQFSSVTLPRLRLRLTSNVANPAERYSREAEFLANSAAGGGGYDALLARSDTRYTAEGYPALSPALSPAVVYPEVPFIPSPPAQYRGESTPLSPRSLLGKTAREAAAVAAVARPEDPPRHPESPDEGYVGDAMDV